MVFLGHWDTVTVETCWAGWKPGHLLQVQHWNWPGLGCCFSEKQLCSAPLVELWLWRDQDSGAWTPKLIGGNADVDSVISSVSYRLCARLGAALKLPGGHAGPLALGFSTCFHSGKQHPPRLRGLRSSCSSSSIFSSYRIMADISLWNGTLYSAFHSHWNKQKMSKNTAFPGWWALVPAERFPACSYWWEKCFLAEVSMVLKPTSCCSSLFSYANSNHPHLLKNSFSRSCDQCTSSYPQPPGCWPATNQLVASSWCIKLKTATNKLLALLLFHVGIGHNATWTRGNPNGRGKVLRYRTLLREMRQILSCNGFRSRFELLLCLTCWPGAMPSFQWHLTLHKVASSDWTTTFKSRLGGERTGVLFWIQQCREERRLPPGLCLLSPSGGTVLQPHQGETQPAGTP